MGRSSIKIDQFLKGHVTHENINSPFFIPKGPISENIFIWVFKDSIGILEGLIKFIDLITMKISFYSQFDC